MARYCAVYGCISSDKYDKNRRFFRLPSDEIRCMLWLRVIDRWDLAEKPLTALSKRYVCDLHFKSTDHNIKKLKISAVPSLNLPDLFGAKNPEKSTLTEEKETNEASTQTDFLITCSAAEKSTQTTQNLTINSPRKRKLSRDLRIECKKRKVLENQLKCV